MHLGLAIRVFFAVLFNAATAAKVRQVIDGSSPSTPEPARPAAPESKPEPRPAPVANKPARSEAITLLATLQREARFLDIVQEPLGSYSDAQIGAAARDVLKNCASVLERLFGPQPVLAQDEGSDVEVPKGYDPMKMRIVGNVTGDPPFRGKLVHHGWMATRCELPAWSGAANSANVVAPIEVEVS